MVETDELMVGVGAVLAQRGEDEKIHTFQYASRIMNQVERNYDAFERQTLAFVFKLRHFRVYLLSTETFNRISNHNSLKDAFKKKDLHVNLAEWLELFSEYEFVI